MKYKITLFLISILFISCNTKTVEVELNSTGGMAYQGESKGKKFSFGSDEDAKIAVDLILAFAQKDTETMIQLFHYYHSHTSIPLKVHLESYV